MLSLNQYQLIRLLDMWMLIMQLSLTFLELNLFRKKFKKSSGKKIKTNIYGMHWYNSIMFRCVCIGFIDFMLKSKNMPDHINLFSPDEYEKNDKIIQNIFNN